MKPYQARGVDFLANRQKPVSTNGNVTINAGAVHTNGMQGPAPNRRQRLKNEKFNRLLSKRLKKDGIPASVEVLPDGGLHVNVKVEQEEKE